MIRQAEMSRRRKRAEGGFSLIEVMISMVILTVGLVSLLGVFGLAMASTQTSQQDMIAKQLANEAMESIVTARNTSQLTFDDIQNVNNTNCPITNASTCGIFMSNAQPIYNSGVDGIYGTSDDSNAGLETIEEPGPDGRYGDTDDVILPLSNYQRTISISAVNDQNGVPITTLRAVNITVQYSTPQTRQQKTYVLSSFISQYR
jgi:prepilin-type N-terminal cleavage/methylation domain-containing protein